jgi:hypothetical protein
MNIRGIAASLLIAASTLSIPVMASAQQYGMGQGNYTPGERFTRREGMIASVQGSSVTLQDGRTLFLRQGTVINPTGRTLRAGQRITFSGQRDGRGRINATEIDVMRRH